MEKPIIVRIIIAKLRQMPDRPFFGKMCKTTDRVHFMNKNYYLEITEVSYFFLGIEVYRGKKEAIKHHTPDLQQHKKG